MAMADGLPALADDVISALIDDMSEEDDPGGAVGKIKADMKPKWEAALGIIFQHIADNLEIDGADLSVTGSTPHVK